MLAGLLQVVGPAAARAQTAVYGSIVGVVTDQSGAVLPGLPVTATNVATNITTPAAVTDSRGNYRIENLVPGAYRVVVESPSFKRFVREGVSLSSTQAVRVDVVLELGALNEEVTVRQATPLIDTESGQIAAVRTWDNRKFLPTSNPSFFSTLALDAGAVTANPGFFVSFAGSLPTQYNYSINGSTFRSPLAGHIALVANFNEWQQEVKASYVNNSAEFSSLANIDVTTKAGTNRFRGSAAWYYTSGGLQGRSPFSPVRPSGNRHLFAGSLGGPIARDRAFFYASYSGNRNSSAVTRVATVPTALMRQGNFNELSRPIIDPRTGQPFPGNVIPASRISPVAQRFIEMFYPLPNSGGAGFNADNYRVSVPQSPAEDNLLLRLDYKFSDQHLAFASYVFDEGGRGGFFTGSLPTVGFRQGYRRDQNLALSDVYAFSAKLSNELGIGWGRDHNLIRGSTFGPDVASAIGLQGIKPLSIPAIPTMNIAGFTRVEQQSFQDIPEDIYSVRDTLTWTRGRHRVKTGVLFTHGRAGQIPFGVDNFYGNFSFSNNFATGNAMADFLLGLPQTAFRLNADFFDSVQWRRNTYQAFVQDDFNVTRKLTVGLGLRYEYHQPFKEQGNRQYTFDRSRGAIVVLNDASLGVVSPLVARAFPILTAAQAGYPDRLVKSDWNNFAPRVSVAYRLSPSSVVRGGYGIFYDFNPPLQGDISPFVPNESFPANRLVGGVPLFQFPNPFPAEPLPIGTLTLNGSRADVAIPYSHQWNATWEQELRPGTAVRLSYIGTRGRARPWGSQINVPEPSTTPFSQSRRPFPQFGPITLQENGASHQYHAGQVRVEHRQGGLFLAAHYTLARDVGEDPMTVIVNPLDLHANRGNLFHIPRHQFVSEFNWELPVGRGRTFGADWPGALDALLGGWRMTGIFMASSGHFLTPTYNGYDATGTNILSGAPDLIGDPGAGDHTRDRWFNTDAFAFPGADPSDPRRTPSGPIGRFGNAGVGIVEGPGFWQFDFGLAKRLPVGADRVGLHVFMLATNLFNHPSLGDPNTTFSAPNLFGRISGIRNDGNASGIGMRQIQIGARIEF
jgi:hypothetical protein